MQPRTIILLSLLIAVAMIGLVFAILYRDQVDQLIGRIIAGNTDCRNILSEEDCQAREYCQGIYGPSCPDCDDVVFLECKPFDEQAAGQLRTQQELCEQTDGDWYQSNLVETCLCDKLGEAMVFDPQQGCISR